MNTIRAANTTQTAILSKSQNPAVAVAFSFVRDPNKDFCRCILFALLLPIF
jgi:hypothetical protein